MQATICGPRLASARPHWRSADPRPHDGLTPPGPVTVPTPRRGIQRWAIQRPCRRMTMSHVDWASDNPKTLDWNRINSGIADRGFAIIRCPDAERARLQSLAQHCGVVRYHERSDSDGITEIRSVSDGEKNEIFRGLSSATFPPHT